jgi:hypothetical protein
MTETLPFVRNPSAPTLPPRPTQQRDVAVVAIPLLEKLRDCLRLAATHRQLIRKLEAASPEAIWGVPPLFFFDHRHGVEPRPSSLRDDVTRDAARRDPIGAAAWQQLPDLCDDVLTVLSSEVEARHAARAVEGFRASVEVLAGENLRVRELSHVLNLTDDQVVRIIDPLGRTGLRLWVRGLADVNHLGLLLNRISPAIWRQFYRPEALRSDGTLPPGLSGADHWFWGREAVSTVPLLEGERTLLVDIPARQPITCESRMKVRIHGEIRVLETMTTNQVETWIETMTGHELPRQSRRLAA